ncbi:c-type cytochrome [Yoonia litorea]|uniref:Cytochrome c556 n=1 Tax=Yoonia litorea TaxID=1123755 RepID=A0A1I6M2J5_9RHOB|nr:cytochrome c [Yoonia litorea]SFS09906.1 Cytochrome c556 [Yoonia litorea]
MKKKIFTPAVCSMIIAMVTPAFADGHLSQDQERAIAARQSHMGLLGFNLGPLGAMAQERLPYDADVAAAAAANLAALASMSQDRYWLEGTDTGVGGNRAKAEIWSDPDGFDAEMQGLATATVALASVAGDGLDAMRAAFGAVGQSCGSCHEAYRAPRN